MNPDITIILSIQKNGEQFQKYIYPSDNRMLLRTYKALGRIYSHREAILSSIRPHTQKFQ